MKTFSSILFGIFCFILAIVVLALVKSVLFLASFFWTIALLGVIAAIIGMAITDAMGIGKKD